MISDLQDHHAEIKKESVLPLRFREINFRSEVLVVKTLIEINGSCAEMHNHILILEWRMLNNLQIFYFVNA